MVVFQSFRAIFSSVFITVMLPVMPENRTLSLHEQCLLKQPLDKLFLSSLQMYL
jgi:hypothetical protein